MPSKFPGKGGLTFHQGGVTNKDVGFIRCMSCRQRIPLPHSSSLCNDCVDPRHFGFAKGVWPPQHPTTVSQD